MVPFLKSILGNQGTKVMESLEKASDDLASYITPRIIVSWLRQADYGEVSLPEDGPFTALAKSGYGYTGSCNIHDQPYSFEYVTEEHIAAIVTTACDCKLTKSEAKNLDLAKLAKTIDLLVKAAKALQYERTQHVQPLEPEGFVPPDTTQAKQAAKPIIPRVGKAPKKMTIPAKPKRKKIQIWKSETARPCGLCGQSMFIDNKFVGCTCFKPLAKSISSSDDKLTITLEFDDSVDDDAMLTLIGALKHGR
jgi:hypothetical protein